MKKSLLQVVQNKSFRDVHLNKNKLGHIYFSSVINVR